MGGSTSETVVIAADDLERFVRDVLVAAGYRERWAADEAEVLVWAELRGVSSHGVLRVPPYLSWMERDLRRPDADIRVVSDRGPMAILDADRGPGLYVMRRAMDLAVERAHDHVIGWVLVRDATHTGPMGFYVRQASDAGMIGIASCSSRPLMAYHGTRDPALGTTPLAIAVPRAGAAPLVLDMASSEISMGAIAQARQRGEPLPDGAALDDLGVVTTDPARATTPLPLAGPKGAGLGVMIECLTSLLVGSPLLATALEDPAQRTDYVQNALAIAVDPTAFPGGPALADEVQRLARDLADLAPADGFDEILMPGERGDRVAAQRRLDGVPLPAGVWSRLVDEAERRGVRPPASAR